MMTEGSSKESTMLYELSAVTKRFSRGRKTIDALAGVDLTIDEGEFLAIQGSTGSGKTTLLQLLGAMDQPTAGSLSYGGRDLVKMRERDLSELRSHSFGFVFQAFNLIPTLTAQENVETALVPWRVPADERRRRAGVRRHSGHPPRLHHQRLLHHRG
jgi:putative ABC transport system ATP-binding protein